MKSGSTPSLTKAADIESELAKLVGLRLFKCWKLLGTRIFYFSAAGPETPRSDWDFMLSLECPWRIEKRDQVVVGSQDYGLPASGNSDPAWKPNAQSGHLQDEKLRELLGRQEDAAIYSLRPDLVVESVKADAVGGFRLQLSGGYSLAAFPTTDNDMQWLLKRSTGGYLILMKGSLHRADG